MAFSPDQLQTPPFPSLPKQDRSSPAAPGSIPCFGGTGAFHWMGLTKREQAAIAIMAGLCADPTIDAVNPHRIANAAVAAADALFDELEKPR
jgi:hypothetical protein